MGAGPQKDHAVIRSLELPALPLILSGRERDFAFQCWGGGDQGATRILEPVPPGKAKTWNRSNIVVSSLEALKMVHFKKNSQQQQQQQKTTLCS